MIMKIERNLFIIEFLSVFTSLNFTLITIKFTEFKRHNCDSHHWQFDSNKIQKINLMAKVIHESVSKLATCVCPAVVTLELYSEVFLIVAAASITQSLHVLSCVDNNYNSPF